MFFCSKFAIIRVSCVEVLILMMEFGTKVKVVRQKLGVTQMELAKMLNVAYSTINRWENAHHDPSYKASKKLDEICNKYQRYKHWYWYSNWQGWSNLLW